MSRKATGALRPLADGWEARVRIDDKGTRKGFALVVRDETAARVRCEAMADIALRLRRADEGGQVVKILEMAAAARTGPRWEAVLSAVDTLCAGDGATTPLSAGARVTVEEFGKEWRSGDLHRKYPDRVPEIDHTRNTGLAKLYVDPVLGHKTVASITLDDADDVMARIPAAKAPGTRRHVAQYVRRILALSVYPGRLRAANPIPKGWLPSAKSKKAKECLYPAEDATLLRCTSVILLRRLAYGFLAREGMRTDELAQLTWRDLDLERGHLTLDVNKTDDPRDWELDPGVVRALARWKKVYCKGASGTDHVFVDGGVPLNVAHLANWLRGDLKRAGVTRPQLFERSATRRPIRAHDLRATFVTVALATGKTETWVADRTGHTTSQMINTYRRKARGWNMGTLAPLDEAIPELAPAAHERPMGGSTRGNEGRRHNGNRDESGDTLLSQTGLPLLGSAAARHRGSSPLPSTDSEKQALRSDDEAEPEVPGHEHGSQMVQSTNDRDRDRVALAFACRRREQRDRDLSRAEVTERNGDAPPAGGHRDELAPPDGRWLGGHANPQERALDKVHPGPGLPGLYGQRRARSRMGRRLRCDPDEAAHARATRLPTAA